MLVGAAQAQAQAQAPVWFREVLLVVVVVVASAYGYTSPQLTYRNFLHIVHDGMFRQGGVGAPTRRLDEGGDGEAGRARRRLGKVFVGVIGPCRPFSGSALPFYACVSVCFCISVTVWK